MMITLVFTGMRSSELRGLIWSMVDFANHTITVSKRVDRYGLMGFTKSQDGQRIIPVPRSSSTCCGSGSSRAPRGRMISSSPGLEIFRTTPMSSSGYSSPPRWRQASRRSGSSWTKARSRCSTGAESRSWSCRRNTPACMPYGISSPRGASTAKAREASSFRRPMSSTVWAIQAPVPREGRGRIPDGGRQKSPAGAACDIDATWITFWRQMAPKCSTPQEG